MAPVGFRSGDRRYSAKLPNHHPFARVRYFGSPGNKQAQIPVSMAGVWFGRAQHAAAFQSGRAGRIVMQPERRSRQMLASQAALSMGVGLPNPVSIWKRNR